MKSNFKIALVATALLTVGSLTASQAFAGGFLADALTTVIPAAAPIADALDQANAQLGHPVDQAGAGIVNYYVPGAGPVVYYMWTR